MIGTTQAAKLLNISPRRLRHLLAQDRVHGAFKAGRNWVIPTVNGYPKIATASRGPKSTWKKVRFTAQNVIHINRQLIGTKMDDGQFAPPISVKCRNENTYSSRVVIPGPCVLVYDFENPQKDCGATAWVETFCEPMLEDGCTYQQIMDKNPKPVKGKSRKASGQGFAKKADCPVAA
ncbi:DNA-binding protein [Rivularia sp. UHCC 0363]|uniref:DNA-binding protein n=1 Tax=Rivularia sp. UHCC 0363 TaxID=3110244 RepID=UPI002B21DDE7|nr:DNA-binding protein [Rivularia sp. UHCC 0363]MEA5595633.1 DNA-binding protein [Rivularia sp. UHCC 0363]